MKLKYTIFFQPLIKFINIYLLLVFSPSSLSPFLLSLLLPSAVVIVILRSKLPLPPPTIKFIPEHLLEKNQYLPPTHPLRRPSPPHLHAYLYQSLHLLTMI